MNCVKCGKEIEDSALFCPYCGEKVEANEIEEVVIEDKPKEENSVNPTVPTAGFGIAIGLYAASFLMAPGLQGWDSGPGSSPCRWGPCTEGPGGLQSVGSQRS